MLRYLQLEALAVIKVLWNVSPLITRLALLLLAGCCPYAALHALDALEYNFFKSLLEHIALQHLLAAAFLRFCLTFIPRLAIIPHIRSSARYDQRLKDASVQGLQPPQTARRVASCSYDKIPTFCIT
jgi:hypothetical protein